jgi:RHS repeat-associated protein
VDYLGSIKDIIDDNGTILSHLSYDSFGRVTGRTGNIDFRYGYTGREWDKDTGLNYYRARYYDPNTGTFIGVDPIGFGAGDTNLYRYVGNNPTNFIDPLGLYEIFSGNVIQSVLNTAGSSYNLINPLGALINNPFQQMWDWAKDNPIVQKFNVKITCNLGESYAKDALDYYVDLINNPRTPWWQKAGAYVGGGLSALWLPENSNTTAAVLQTAWGFGRGLSAARGRAGTGGGGGGLGNAGKGWGNNLRNWGNNFLQGAGDRLRNLLGQGSCFVAGTQILTLDGNKNIEDIQVGDWVLSDDPTTPGGVQYKQVLDTFVRYTTLLIDISIDGEVISTTSEHPFWVPNIGWVAAEDLVVGSTIQTDDGRILDVDEIDKREGYFTVYNFNVDEFHSYFVSELGVLVHNQPCEKQLARIAKIIDKHDYGDFIPCAKELSKCFKKNKISGRTIEINSGVDKGFDANLFDDSLGVRISETGRHRGLVTDIDGVPTVFDNFHNGKPLDRWLNDITYQGKILDPSKGFQITDIDVW